MRIVLILVAGLMSVTPAWASGPFGCGSQELFVIPATATGRPLPGAENASGTSKLCVLPDGLHADLHVWGLNAGDAVTVWWIYFDDPTQCLTPGMCADPDFFPQGGSDKPQGIFGRMGSNVVGKQGHVRVSGTWGGMAPPPGSQVWTLMFTHGEAGCAERDPGTEACRSHTDALARQTLTPEDSDFPPQLGNLEDGQRFFGALIAVFPQE